MTSHEHLAALRLQHENLRRGEPLQGRLHVGEGRSRLRESSLEVNGLVLDMAESYAGRANPEIDHFTSCCMLLLVGLRAPDFPEKIIAALWGQLSERAFSVV
jgi:hypothetical protein